jgi:signal transduction histidine kinase
VSPAATAAGARRVLGRLLPSIPGDSPGEAIHQAFVVNGSFAQRVVIGQVGALVSLVLGSGLALAMVLDGVSEAEDVGGLLLVGMALGACVALRHGAVPLWVMDLATVATEVTLAAAGIYGGDEVRIVLPAIYVSIGTSVCLIRPVAGAIAHMVAFSASYGAVVVFGPDVNAPLTRWLAVVSAIAASGTFVRWLVHRVVELAEAEHEASLELVESTKELSAQDEARTVFLAKMSHELRTPLNAVVGFADVLHDELAGPLDDLQQELVTDIADSGRDLLALVDDLLDLRKIGEGHIQLRRSHVDLCDVARTVERLLSERAVEAGVHVRLRLPSRPLVVSGDPLRVRQILWNLVGNAIKYSPAGADVEILVSEHAGVARTVVTDRGPGIAPEDHERIFQLYEQGIEAAPGSGIGLALCRRLSEAHGGSLTAAARPEGGSAFRLDLPVGGPDTSAAAAEDDEPAAVGLSELDRAILIPGSPANRLAVARVGRQFARSMAALLPLFAVITPGPVVLRIGFGALGLASLVVAQLLRSVAERDGAGLAPHASDAWSLAGFGIIGAAVVLLRPLQDVVALAFGWPVLSASALASGPRLAVHMAAALGVYAVALVLAEQSRALEHWLALAMIVSTNGIVVRWVAGRLRAAVVALLEARFVAESRQREVALVAAHKRDFLASTSHELLTPLNAILGASAFLIDGQAGELSDAQRDHASDIHASGQVLLTLLTDLLDLAKLEDGRHPRLVEPVDLPGLAAGVVAQVRPLAEAQQLTLELHADVDLPPVLADPENLRRAVGILLVNGIRFTPPGGHVDVVVGSEADRVHVRVRDTGMGIEASQIPLVFQPFHQGVRRPAVPAEGSSGLGLPLARGLVELEGGTMDVESTPDLGSTFTISMPPPPGRGYE